MISKDVLISELKHEIINELDSIINGNFAGDNDIIDHMEFLLDSAKSFNLKHIQYELENACDNGDLDLMKYIISYARTHNISLDLDHDGGYMSHTCAVKGNLKILKYLYKNGASVKQKNEGILGAAAVNDEIEVVKYLVETCGCDPRKLKGTSYYNNYPRIMEYFDDYCKLLEPL
jgi:ankyrin repeat protein